MKKLKRISLALLALCSGSLSAGVMGQACNSENSAVPCERPGWDFGIDALILKPAFDRQLFLTSSVDENNNRVFNNYKLKWYAGFKAEASYHFYTGNDITVDWYYYKHGSSNAFVTGTANNRVATFLENHPKWDAVNAEFGQQINFGSMKHLRLHGGVQYARVANNFQAARAEITGLSRNVDDVFTKYIGFGPRVGVNYDYDWANGLGFYANAAGSLLVGHQNFDTASFGVLDRIGFSSGSKSSIVPELEAKIAARYTCAMPQGDLSFDLGYMVLNYFNVFSFRTVSGVSGSSDFQLQGPFIGMKYLGYI